MLRNFLTMLLFSSLASSLSACGEFEKSYAYGPAGSPRKSEPALFLSIEPPVLLDSAVRVATGQTLYAYVDTNGDTTRYPDPWIRVEINLDDGQGWRDVTELVAAQNNHGIGRATTFPVSFNTPGDYVLESRTTFPDGEVVVSGKVTDRGFTTGQDFEVTVHSGAAAATNQ